MSLKVELDERHSPQTWVSAILGSVSPRSGGVVENHLVDATLERRFGSATALAHRTPIRSETVENLKGTSIPDWHYHVSAKASREEVRKSTRNFCFGCHPVLLVPSDQITAAETLAEDEDVAQSLTILPIESFISHFIFQLAVVESQDCFSILRLDFR